MKIQVWLAALLLVFMGMTCSAQIYTGEDENGNLIMSDKPFPAKIKKQKVEVTPEEAAERNRILARP